MKKSKYLIAALPLFTVILIQLVGVMIERHETCVIFSKIAEPCIIKGIDLHWFANLAFFNFLFGWLFAIWSILKIARYLGQDLPKPWGMNS